MRARHQAEPAPESDRDRSARSRRNAACGPLPNDLAIVGGKVAVPASPADSPAQTEFNQNYLGSLNGFPFESTAQVFFSGPLDPATVVPQNIVVLDITSKTAPTLVTGLTAPVFDDNSDDGSCSDGDRANESKRLPPAFGRHADPGKRERGVVAGDRRGRCENESDEVRAPGGEAKVAKTACPMTSVMAPASEPDEQPAKDACSAMVGGKARGHAGEEGQRVDGEIEHQPAQKADAKDAENYVDDKHGGALHDQVARMLRAFHHHHGADQSIGEEDREREKERKSWEVSAGDFVRSAFLGLLKPWRRSEHSQPELFRTRRHPAQKLPFDETAGIGRQAGVEDGDLYAQFPPEGDFPMRARATWFRASLQGPADAHRQFGEDGSRA